MKNSAAKAHSHKHHGKESEEEYKEKSKEESEIRHPRTLAKVTPQEIETLKNKLIDLIQQSPDKTALIIQSWMNNSPRPPTAAPAKVSNISRLKKR